MSESLLPPVNTDPKLAPTTVAVEWTCTTPDQYIDSTPRTVALLLGRFGEVELRSLRVQFARDLPPEFEAYAAVYQVGGTVNKRGIAVAQLQGKPRAVCYCDLPAPAACLIASAGPTLPVWSSSFIWRNLPEPKARDGFMLWAGIRSDLRADMHRGLAVVVQSNVKSICSVSLSGV